MDSDDDDRMIDHETCAWGDNINEDDADRHVIGL